MQLCDRDVSYKVWTGIYASTPIRIDVILVRSQLLIAIDESRVSFRCEAIYHILINKLNPKGNNGVALTYICACHKKSMSRLSI